MIDLVEWNLAPTNAVPRRAYLTEPRPSAQTLAHGGITTNLVPFVTDTHPAAFLTTAPARAMPGIRIFAIYTLRPTR